MVSVQALINQKYFLFFHKSIFEQNPVLGYKVNLTLRLKIFWNVLESFFPHKTPSFLFNKVTLQHMVCALKEELPPFLNNLI